MGRVKEKGDAIQQSKSPPKMTDELLNCLERGRALWTVVFFHISMGSGLAFMLCMERNNLDTVKCKLEVKSSTRII